MNTEVTPEQLITAVENDIMKSFEGISLYASGNDSTGQQQAEVKRVAITQLAQILIAKHSESHPKRGQSLKVWNSKLDFSNSSRVQRTEIQKIISDYKIDNFLYIKPKHFIDAFYNRYNLMETEYKEYFKRTGVEYQRISHSTQSFEAPTLIFGRLTIDKEEDFLTDNVQFEFYDNKDNLVVCHLNFCKFQDQQYQLFPNMYIAVQVKGDLYDQSCCLKVCKIFEINSEKDQADENESEGSVVKKHMTCLVFKGPYNLEGNAYFAGFDMIKHHVQKERPNVIVLIGPFVSDEQFHEDAAGELETIDEFANIRDKNIQRLSGIVADIDSTCQIVMISDLAEADNVYPVPIPPTIQSQPNTKGITVHIAGSPCMLSIGGTPIAFLPQDILTPCNKFPSHVTGKRFVQTLRSIVSQKCLHPVYPLAYPFDVTQIEQLSWANVISPKLLIYSSRMTSFLGKARGTLVANARPILEDKEFGSFIRIQVDVSSPDSVDSIRLDLLQF